MSTPKTLKKEPFQKIRSRLDRNALLSKLAKQKESLICKGDGDFVFRFTASDFNEKEGLIGKISENTSPIKNGETVVANFQVEDDKYFIQTAVVIEANREILSSSENIFLMQRRAYIRVDLAEKFNRGISIIQQKDKAVFAAGECLDISAGGARILLSGDPFVTAAGEKLKVVFHVGKWEFEAPGIVRHVRKNDQGVTEFGFEFDRTIRPLVSKLDLVMLELQKLTFIHGG